MSMNRRQFMASTAAGSIAALASVSAGAQRKKYRACVIGDSKRGGYGHSLHLMWTLRDDVETVALADPDEEGRLEHAREAGAARTYADYREMLKTEKPDLVAVGPRWSIHHKEYLLACAEHGAHGLLEKPLAPDLAEADAIVRAVEAKNLKWSMAFNFRASPLIDHTRQLIFEDGLIGDVLEVRSRGKEDHRAGGEDLIVLGIHLFDLMAYFMGEPHWVWAHISAGGRAAARQDIREATEPLGPIVGERLQAVYAFDEGVKGYFSSMANPHGNGGRWGMELFGSKGIVTIRMDAVPRIYYLPESTWAPGGRDSQWRPLPDAPELDYSYSPVGHYQPIVDDLIAAIEEDRQPRFGVRSGLLATEMIQGVWASHFAKQRVEIPMEKRDHPLA